MKYSFIVPAFNIQDYIGECLKSLVSLSYDDFEIIVVNDGSFDNTLEVIKSFFSNHHIVLIDKSNGGLSDARNDAIRIARGDYLIFIDGDDYVVGKDFLSRLDSIPLHDVYCFLYYECDKNELNIIKRNKFNDHKLHEKTINRMIKTNSYFSSAWSKIVRRDFLIQKKLFFNKGLSEDIDWSYRILLYTDDIFFVRNFAYYVYRTNRNGSITNQVKSNFISGWCNIIDRCENYFEIESSKVVFSKKRINSLKTYLSNLYYIIYVSSLKVGDNLSYLKYYSYLKYGKGLRVFLIRLANIFLGRKLAFRLLSKKYKNG